MNEELVDERLETCKIRLNDHSKRIDCLEQRSAAIDVKIGSLCDQIKSLVSTLKWGFGILVAITSLVLGFVAKMK